MKRFFYLLLFCCITLIASAQRAKYVFFFIGDGMGVNQVNGTEMYLAELEGRIGVKPLLMTSFPVASMASTYSVTNGITDSAAGGTALSTGSKTNNGVIGVDRDNGVLVSVAERAKASGRKVGITTSVSVDHATPAAFYAHQPSRRMYYEIALDIPRAGFDFHAGSGFLKPNKTFDGQDAPEVIPLLEEAGYTIARGVDDFKAKMATADRMILIQEEGQDNVSLPYAIDRQEGQMTLKDITESAIAFLTKGKDTGFFLMVEGGKIDWSCHNNDAATTFREVVDMDEALAVAYAFYKKHPRETLIVVSADHETGGLALGNGSYVLNLQALQYQRASEEELSIAVTNLRKKETVTWDDARALLTEKMGFWTQVPLDWEAEKALRDVFEESFVRNHVVFSETMYAKTEPLAACARLQLNRLAHAGWTTPDHSAGLVPVFAIGAGAELFNGKMENIDIPQRIAKAAGYK